KSLLPQNPPKGTTFDRTPTHHRATRTIPKCTFPTVPENPVGQTADGKKINLQVPRRIGAGRLGPLERAHRWRSLGLIVLGPNSHRPSMKLLNAHQSRPQPLGRHVTLQSKLHPLSVWLQVRKVALALFHYVGPEP